ncbi:hypothetical protein XELAEV_18028392mg [Xenopus laevis]|uniref:Scavenger receptor class A member 5 n=1 Tax=Xenopus laevis TaxID=8355 RepID=A0A974CX23_XENLA|nr:hypothetical protein XELAEV_18028392mg [Xenopus laevis]
MNVYNLYANGPKQVPEFVIHFQLLKKSLVSPHLEEALRIDEQIGEATQIILTGFSQHRLRIKWKHVTHLVVKHYITNAHISRPQSSPEDVKVLTSNVNRLNESYRDLQFKLMQLSFKGDFMEHVWKLQDLFQNHSDSLLQLTESLHKLEENLQSLQDMATKTDTITTNLGANLNHLSDSHQSEVYRLSTDFNSSRYMWNHHDTLLKEMSSKAEGLNYQISEILGTLNAVNATFTYDIGIHHTRIQDLQGLINNVSEETRHMRLLHIVMEQQLKHEMALLNNVTEDLRLKDWEQSITLKNITVIRAPNLQGKIHPDVGTLLEEGIVRKVIVPFRLKLSQEPGVQTVEPWKQHQIVIPPPLNVKVNMHQGSPPIFTVDLLIITIHFPEWPSTSHNHPALQTISIYLTPLILTMISTFHSHHPLSRMALHVPQSPFTFHNSHQGLIIALLFPQSHYPSHNRPPLSKMTLQFPLWPTHFHSEPPLSTFHNDPSLSIFIIYFPQWSSV